MNIWEGFSFNGSLDFEVLTEIGGISLPLDYIEFMKKHNGGNGNVGSIYVVFYKMEELIEINKRYCIEEFMPHHCIIGTNGGGEFLGIDMNGNFFIVPTVLDEDDKVLLGKNLNEFILNLNEYFI